MPDLTAVTRPPATPSVPAAPAGPSAPAAGGQEGRQAGAVGLVLAGVLSVQFGAGVAVLLFDRAGALGVVTLRLGVSAVLLLVLCRPRLRGYRRSDWALAAAFGLALAAMNASFYQALDRIPLGPAVTLEVLGPLVLAVCTSRRAASWLWAALALAGVVLLGGGGFDRLDPVGVGFALFAGAMWAAYILLSAHTGRRFPRADGLAIALAVAALAVAPLGVATAGAALVQPATLALGAVVAVLSSVLPYTCELQALRRLPASTFAVLMSLEPAVAALAGFLVLGQALVPAEAAAIVLVMIACAGAVRTAQRPPVAAGPVPPA